MQVVQITIKIIEKETDYGDVHHIHIHRSFYDRSTSAVGRSKLIIFRIHS
jgi:hypothetical protein